MNAPVYALTHELREALLAYLMGRPYAEVAEGVARLKALEPIPAAPDA
jgi:hypothetical protein